jgi:hypothetical protein
LTEQGVENPYEKFYGRLVPFMHAHSNLTESGDVSFYSQSTSEVAQRALWESSEDSNGERALPLRLLSFSVQRFLLPGCCSA